MGCNTLWHAYHPRRMGYWTSPGRVWLTISVASLQRLGWCTGGDDGGGERPSALSPQELSPLEMVTAHVGVSPSSKKGTKSPAGCETVRRGREVSEGTPRQHHVWVSSKPTGTELNRPPKFRLQCSTFPDSSPACAIS